MSALSASTSPARKDTPDSDIAAVAPSGRVPGTPAKPGVHSDAVPRQRLLFWARSAVSSASFVTGLGPERRNMPALNPDSRRLLVCLCELGTAEPGEGDCPLVVPLADLMARTCFSMSRITFLLALLKHAGLLDGGSEISGAKREEVLRVTLRMGEAG